MQIAVYVCKECSHEEPCILIAPADNDNNKVTVQPCYCPYANKKGKWVKVV